MRFRQFFETSAKQEEKTDIKRMLGKIPSTHAALLKGYTWKFQGANTLKGDSEHIGEVDDKEKTVTICGPWNYPREFTALHEIGHRVWARLDKESQEKWRKLAKPIRPKEPAEELFCMTYAQTYAKNKMVKYDHDHLVQFVKDLPPLICPCSEPTE